MSLRSEKGVDRPLAASRSYDDRFGFIRKWHKFGRSYNYLALDPDTWDIYAVGNTGVLVHISPITYKETVIATGVVGDLYRVCVFDGIVWAAGAAGRIVRYNASTGAVDTDTTVAAADIRGIASANNGYCVCVDDAGNYIKAQSLGGGFTLLETAVEPTLEGNSIAISETYEVIAIYNSNSYGRRGVDTRVWRATFAATPLAQDALAEVMDGRHSVIDWCLWGVTYIPNTDKFYLYGYLKHGMYDSAQRRIKWFDIADLETPEYVWSAAARADGREVVVLSFEDVGETQIHRAHALAVADEKFALLLEIVGRDTEPTSGWYSPDGVSFDLFRSNGWVKLFYTLPLAVVQANVWKISGDPTSPLPVMDATPYEDGTGTVTLTGAAPQSDIATIVVPMNADIDRVQVVRTTTGITPYTAWDVAVFNRNPATDNLDLIYEGTGIVGDLNHQPVRPFPLINQAGLNEIYAQVSATAGGGVGTDIFTVQIVCRERQSA